MEIFILRYGVPGPPPVEQLVAGLQLHVKLEPVFVKEHIPPHTQVSR